MVQGEGYKVRGAGCRSRPGTPIPGLRCPLAGRSCPSRLRCPRAVPSPGGPGTASALSPESFVGPLPSPGGTRQGQVPGVKRMGRAARGSGVNATNPASATPRAEPAGHRRGSPCPPRSLRAPQVPPTPGPAALQCPQRPPGDATSPPSPDRVLSVCLSLCLSTSLCLSLCLSLCPSLCLSLCLSVYLSLHLSVCLSLCLSLCLSMCMSLYPVCVSVHVSVSVSVPMSHPCVCPCVCPCVSPGVCPYPVPVSWCLCVCPCVL